MNDKYVQRMRKIRLQMYKDLKVPKRPFDELVVVPQPLQHQCEEHGSRKMDERALGRDRR